MAFSGQTSCKSYSDFIFDRLKHLWTKCIGTSAVIMLIAVIFGYYGYKGVFMAQMLLAGFFICVAFLIKFKVWELFDTTWTGTIIDAKYKYPKESENDNEPNTYTITIKKDSGRKFKYRFYPDEPELQGYYKKGERIKHTRGTYLFEKEEKNPDEPLICLGCKTLNPYSRGKCTKCALPLIK